MQCCSCLETGYSRCLHILFMIFHVGDSPSMCCCDCRDRLSFLSYLHFFSLSSCVFFSAFIDLQILIPPSTPTLWFLQKCLICCPFLWQTYGVTDFKRFWDVLGQIQSNLYATAYWLICHLQRKSSQRY